MTIRHRPTIIKRISIIVSITIIISINEKDASLISLSFKYRYLSFLLIVNVKPFKI